jgi:hypothetical protein
MKTIIDQTQQAHIDALTMALERRIQRRPDLAGIYLAAAARIAREIGRPQKFDAMIFDER